MKFEDIKVGDTVYIPYKVGGLGGFHPAFYGEFYLPKKVTKTTSKFFDADGLRFRKETGREHTSGYNVRVARNLGETNMDKEVIDESEQYDDAVKLLNKLEKVRYLISRYFIDHKIWTEGDLDVLTELLTKNKSSK